MSVLVCGCLCIYILHIHAGWCASVYACVCACLCVIYTSVRLYLYTHTHTHTHTHTNKYGWNLTSSIHILNMYTSVSIYVHTFVHVHSGAVCGDMYVFWYACMYIYCLQSQFNIRVCIPPLFLGSPCWACCSVCFAGGPFALDCVERYVFVNSIFCMVAYMHGLESVDQSIDWRTRHVSMKYLCSN